MSLREPLFGDNSRAETILAGQTEVTPRSPVRSKPKNK